ncbi:MAG: DNA topoisomerase IB [Gemmataceae bacterium]
MGRTTGTVKSGRRAKAGKVRRRPWPAVAEVVPSPVEAARSAGLRYVTDRSPGIRRIRAGKGFRYLTPDGSRVTDRDTLARLRWLAIPPAWTAVWICPRADGHLQATGIDARGRKQYRYHPRWREVRDATKYDRMILFGRALPRIRRQVAEHLALPGLPREKVLATLVRLLETTLIRIGNAEYARTNESFGLTTMREDHVEVAGSTLRFQFRGKSGVDHRIDLRDPTLARIVRKCQDLPGQELFQYLDADSQPRTVDSADVNDYLRTIAGDDFTAKDFRTWAGTVLAARALQEFTAHTSTTEARQNVVRAIESVAQRLGNTRAVCRKCYVHPAVVDAYLDGSLVETLTQKVSQELTDDLAALPPEEAAVLAFLQARLARDAERRAGKAAG